MSCPPLQELAELLVGERGRVSPEARAHVQRGCEACEKRLAMLHKTTLAPSSRQLRRSAGDEDTAVTDRDVGARMETANTMTPDGEPPARPSMRLMHRGDAIGRYVVSELLGAGGMGVVYAAYDPQLDRKVAVKILRAGFARNISGAHQMLLDEAKAMAKLSHPNVVTVHDVGVFADQVFVAMELVEGQTFRELMRTKPPVREMLRVLLEAGRGLAAAHKAGLVHRDFKPENVLIGRGGRVCVSDFGIARTADGSVSDDVAGTPLYMAPEAHEGVIDLRSDQYSFCLTMLEAVTGAPPTPGAPLAKLDTVPARMRRVLARGLAHEPAARYPAMDALLAELAPTSRKRAWVIGGAAAAVVAATTAIVGVRAVGQPPEPCTNAPAESAAVWNPALLVAVRAAFATDPALGPSVDRTVDELDQWRATWTAEHTRVCRATRVDGTQSVELLDLRMECLRSRAGAVGAIVTQLAAADRAALAFAAASVPAAGDVGRCAGDRDALRSLAVLRDPVLAQHADSLRSELAAVEAQHLAGKSRSLTEPAEALAKRADGLQVALVAAPARFYLGHALAQVGDIPRAVEQLRRAVLDADRAGDDELRLRIQVTLAQLLASNGGDAEADQLIAAAEATVGRLGSRAEHVGAVDTQRAKSAFVRGDYDKAYELAQAAIGRFERAGRSTDSGALAARLVAGTSLEALARRAEARAAYTDAIAQIERGFGKDAPQAVPPMTYLANLEIQDGRFDAAKALLERGISILDSALGEEAVQTTVSRGMLATIYAQQGDPDRARELIERALELASEPAARIQRGTLWSSLGEVERSAGRYNEAHAAFDKAVAELEAHFGAEHPALIEYLSRRSDAARRLGQFGDAEADIARAMAITNARQVGELDQLEYFLAQTLRDAGKLDEAKAALERCTKLGSVATQPMMTALCELELAQMLPPNERGRARELARHARGVFIAGGDNETAADIDRWLAAPAK